MQKSFQTFHNEEPGSSSFICDEVLFCSAVFLVGRAWARVSG
jgi:hypothetical protein